MTVSELAVLDVRPLHGGRFAPDRRTVRAMIEVTVAAAFALPPQELAAKTRRTAPVAFARQISMYVAHVICGWSLTEAGAEFCRDRTTAAHACRVVEDRRDDPTVDQLVETIEHTVHTWLSAVERCSALTPQAMV